jgi:hypothetical protein
VQGSRVPGVVEVGELVDVLFAAQLPVLAERAVDDVSHFVNGADRHRRVPVLDGVGLQFIEDDVPESGVVNTHDSPNVLPVVVQVAPSRFPVPKFPRSSCVTLPS